MKGIGSSTEDLKEQESERGPLSLSVNETLLSLVLVEWVSFLHVDCHQKRERERVARKRA